MTTMQISKETLSILKNFSQLNSNILVKPGNVIKTITSGKNVIAQASVSETFDTEFGIWDLGKFLSTVSLFDTPSFDFGSKSVRISGTNGSSVTYYYSEPELLTTHDKNIQFPETIVSFDFTQSMFSDLQRAASVLQLPDISIRCEEGKIYAVALNKKDPTTNQYSVVIGETEDIPFVFNFKVDNLRMVEGDYRVDVAKGNVSQFTHSKLDLMYWIALESDSTSGY